MGEEETEVSTEVEVHGGVALPKWMSGANLGGRWKRTWTTRAKQVTDTAADELGVTIEELGDLLEKSEQATDVFHRALSRAGEEGNVEYLDALGRLTAAALDDARVDEATYLAAQVLKLEPLQLRTLWSAVRFYEVVGTELVGEVTRDRATHCDIGRVTIDEVRDTEHVSQATAIATLDSLAGMGLLREAYVGPDEKEGVFIFQTSARSVTNKAWIVEEFGLLVTQTVLGLNRVPD